MLLRQVFDPYLAQYAYLIGCQKTGEALIIDPERDVDRYRVLARENGLRITAVAETHIHADFVSGARELAQDPEVRLFLSGEGGADWSYRWTGNRDGVQLLHHGDTFRVGNIEVQALHTPGHTPEHICFVIIDRGGGASEPVAIATGDFLFVGDVGRPDLLETAAGQANIAASSAKALLGSLRDRLGGLADFVQVLPGHGAGSACGKSLGAVPTSTLGYERRFNLPFKLSLTDSESFLKDILQGQPDPPLYFATMKRVNRDGVAVTGGVPRPTKLSAADFASTATNKNTFVVDGRMDLSAYAKAHFPGAIYAPLRSAFFTAAAGSFLGEDEGILLILENESDVDLAARQLYRIGLDKLLGWISVADAQAAGLLKASTKEVAFSAFDPKSALAEGVILDVRTSSEHAARNIPGAISVPYTRLLARLTEVPRGKRLYVHCASGKRAALATSFLASRGIEAIHVNGPFESRGTSCGIG